jgi:putative addiction module component (TIGR02574 family)
MADASKVLSEALDLPVRDRLHIATALLRSVDPEEDEDAAEAWIAEINRRSASIHDRKAELIDADTVHAQIREALRARRALRK